MRNVLEAANTAIAITHTATYFNIIFTTEWLSGVMTLI
jgi:hypothetical protein